VFNATFNNISIISWRSVLLMEDCSASVYVQYNRDVLHTFLSNIEVTTSSMSTVFICINCCFHGVILFIRIETIFFFNHNLHQLVELVSKCILVISRCAISLC